MKAPIALLLAALTITPAPLLAADPPTGENPEVTIRPGDDGEVLHEYRINGQVIEIKVVPKIGKPYYLVPAEGGDGYIKLDRSQLLIPKWILFRW